MNGNDGHFQVIVLGTGLTESIAAASLAKAGYTVAHIDVNEHYGSDEASLSGNELNEWIKKHSSSYDENDKHSSFTTTGSIPSPSRSYYFSLAPSILPARGPLIDALIASGVARYGGFKLLEYISVFSSKTHSFQLVPGSKEEIFKSKDLSLLDKRKLMRFLMFAASDFEDKNEYKDNESVPFVQFLTSTFSLSSELATVIAYALALNQSDAESTSSSLHRLRNILRSAGRYGDSPFLLGLYGGLGELVQGFCRVSAVSGGLYILGHDFTASLSDSPKFVSLDLNDPELPNKLTADLIITSQDFLPKIPLPSPSSGDAPASSPAATGDGSKHEQTRYVQATTIALVDGILDARKPGEKGASEKVRDRPADGALFVYPPGALEAGNAPGPVSVLINGDGTDSCPKGQTIVYATTTLPLPTSANATPPSPQTLLDPYLTSVLPHINSPTGIPSPTLFTLSYLKSISSPSTPTPHTRTSLYDKYKEHGVLVAQPPSPLSFCTSCASTGDAGALAAERLFRASLGVLRKDDGDVDVEEIPFWPALPNEDEDEALVDG